MELGYVIMLSCPFGTWRRSPPANFENLRRRVERAPIACESCN